MAERSRVLYDDIVAPAAELHGLECVRIDPNDYGTNDHRLFGLLGGADAVVVDASADSMDYLHSLGVRHALSDRPTIVLLDPGQSAFDVIIQQGVVHIKSGVPHFAEISRARADVASQLSRLKAARFSPVLVALEQMPRLFLSYAHQDRESVAAVDQWLRDRGARVDVDERNFVAGRDVREEIVNAIRRAGKVVCFYSSISEDRYYTKLERRLSEQVEFEHHATGRVVLVYFRLDDTPLPPESSHRLAINAWRLGFDEACGELWRHLLEQSAEPTRVSLDAYRSEPPWSKGSRRDSG